jgi:hypothetical protein
MARPLALLALFAPLSLTLGCAGSPIAAPLEGEPVCPDFKAGSVLMAGGLRYPVRVRVLDGKNVLFKTILPGLRTAGARKPSTFIVDDNAEYTVEWSQCENERAPGEAGAANRERKARGKMRDDESAGYECGEAKVYKTEKLATRKHDPASHVITFAPPPSAVCWASDATTTAAPGADAGAPDAGSPTEVDAGAVGAGVVDAGAAGSAVPAPATSK